MTIQKHTKILTVFSFLRLRSPDIFWYQWVYPTLIFALVYFGGYAAQEYLINFDRSKLVDDINVLMGVLVGFYIAALAAVSSFTNENLDQIMKGRAPTFTMKRQGQDVVERMTRRRFLAVLFGYCASISIALFVFGVAQGQIEIVTLTNPWLKWTVSALVEVFWAIYLWLLASLLVVTLLGLHYLIERMHRS